MMKCKRGQGATEYLLMLAAVLVIVAIAVYYVTSVGPSFSITPLTGYPKVSDTDNALVLFAVDKVVPAPLSAADLSVKIVKPDGTDIYSSHTPTTGDITSGTTIRVTCTEAVPRNSEIWFTYKGSTVKFTIAGGV
jgi:uncharacterized protein (UPF0333 family)